MSRPKTQILFLFQHPVADVEGDGDIISLLMIFGFHDSFLSRIKPKNRGSSLNSSFAPYNLCGRKGVGLYFLFKIMTSVLPGLGAKPRPNTHSLTSPMACYILSPIVSTNVPEIVRITSST